MQPLFVIVTPAKKAELNILHMQKQMHKQTSSLFFLITPNFMFIYEV